MSNVKNENQTAVNSALVMDSQVNPFLVPSADGTGFKSLHGVNSWLDKGAHLINDGLVVSAENNIPIVFTWNEKTYTVLLSVLVTAALYEPIRSGQIDQFLNLWSKGYNTVSQLNFAGKTLEKDLIDTLPGIVDLGFTSASKTKGSKLITVEKLNLTQADITSVTELGYIVHGVAYDTSNLLAPVAIGLKIEVVKTGE